MKKNLLFLLFLLSFPMYFYAQISISQGSLKKSKYVYPLPDPEKAAFYGYTTIRDLGKAGPFSESFAYEVLDKDLNLIASGKFTVDKSYKLEEIIPINAFYLNGKILYTFNGYPSKYVLLDIASNTVEKKSSFARFYEEKKYNKALKHHLNPQISQFSVYKTYVIPGTGFLVSITQDAWTHTCLLADPATELLCLKPKKQPDLGGGGIVNISNPKYYEVFPVAYGKKYNIFRGRTYHPDYEYIMLTDKKGKILHARKLFDKKQKKFVRMSEIKGDSIIMMYYVEYKERKKWNAFVKEIYDAKTFKLLSQSALTLNKLGIKYLTRKGKMYKNKNKPKPSFGPILLFKDDSSLFFAGDKLLFLDQNLRIVHKEPLGFSAKSKNPFHLFYANYGTDKNNVIIGFQNRKDTYKIVNNKFIHSVSGVYEMHFLKIDLDTHKIVDKRMIKVNPKKDKFEYLPAKKGYIAILDHSAKGKDKLRLEKIF